MSYPPPPPDSYQPDNSQWQTTTSTRHRYAHRRPGLIVVSILGGIIAVVAFTVSSFSKLRSFASSTHSIDQHVTVDGLETTSGLSTRPNV